MGDSSLSVRCKPPYSLQLRACPPRSAVIQIVSLEVGGRGKKGTGGEEIINLPFYKHGYCHVLGLDNKLHVIWKRKHVFSLVGAVSCFTRRKRRDEIPAWSGRENV